MQLILAANTIENAHFPVFVHDAMQTYPNAAVALTGDLLNVFPEPGEDFESSIFYEIYGELLPQEMHRLHAQHFNDIQNSTLIAPLHEFFDPDGRTYCQALALASRRYARVFGEMSRALRGRMLYYIPGNMDYPRLGALFASSCPNIQQLDGEIMDIQGVRVAGVGGIPHSCQPFHEVAPISPYEVTDLAFERSLKAVWGAEILISHLSPAESPVLEAFVRESPVRMVICRAPFNLQSMNDCRGASQYEHSEGKWIVRVRAFEYPKNDAFVVDFSPDVMIDPSIEEYCWQAPGSSIAAGSAAALV